MIVPHKHGSIAQTKLAKEQESGASNENSLAAFSTHLGSSDPNNELGHANLELFLNVGNLHARAQVGEVQLLAEAVIVRVRIEDVIAPFVLDIPEESYRQWLALCNTLSAHGVCVEGQEGQANVHVGPSPSLFEGPS